MARVLSRILADCRGATVVEFAFAAPVLLMIMLGVFKMGSYHFAQNSVNNALEEAARSAAVYPTPADSQLQATFADNLLKQEADVKVELGITHGTSSGIDYVDLSTRYVVPIDIAFVDLGDIPVSASRRVYLPK